jgi:hypothetical protein
MAFVEFDDEDVGPIAAEALHEMIIGGKIVKAVSIPAEKVKRNMVNQHNFFCEISHFKLVI